jgi:hypothetical protein
MRGITRLLIASLLAAGLIPGLAFSQGKGAGRGLAEKNFAAGNSDGVRLLLNKMEGGVFVPAAPGDSFSRGGVIKIGVESNFDGYVYAVDVTPGGYKKVVFPASRTAGATLRQGQLAELTAMLGSNLAPTQGTGVIQVVVSRSPIQYLEDAIGRPNALGVASAGSGNGSGIVSDNVQIVLPQGGLAAAVPQTVGIAGGRTNSDNGSLLLAYRPAGSGKLAAGEVLVFELHLQMT